MSSQILTTWPEIFAAGAEQAGGKGWNLARLARYGLPVAECVVIPATCEQEWLQESGLTPQLQQASAAIDKIPHQLESLHRELLQRPLPQSLLGALAATLAARAWQHQPLAVRSSATCEDSGNHSFAGIHLSRLNVIGPEALLNAIREVWASRWTPAAAAYRSRMGLDHGAVAMAVVIMPLLPARACGIAFTCDPRTGRDDQIHVHAHWGLGESLVGGTARGDEVVLAEDVLDDSLRLLSYHTGAKATMTVPASQGTCTVTTPPELTQQRVLDDQATLKLWRLLRDAAIALDFAQPFFDIEWVWDGENFWLLQARPITAKPRYTYPELSNQADIWTRGNTCEVLPDPLSPIDWFSSRRLVNLLLEQGPKLIRYPLLPGAQRAGLFNGRLYLNLSLMQWEFYEIFGAKPHAINAMMGGHQPEIRVPKPTWRERLRWLKNLLHYLILSHRFRRSAEDELEQIRATARAWRQRPLPEDDTALLQHIREQSRLIRSAKEIFFLQSSSGASLSQLTEIVDKRLPGEGHALTAALLAGGSPSVTAKQNYALVELARMAASDDLIRNWLATPQRNNDWQQQLPSEHPFRHALAEFLEQYGHRAVYESYLRNPRWREAPGYIFDTIHGLMETDLESLQHLRRRATLEAQQRIKQQVPRWLQPLIRKMAESAVREVNHREAARSALIALLEPLRNTLLAIGRLWHRRGALASADDIFNLTAPEIYDALNGEIPVQGLASRVADRRKQLQEWQHMSASEVILEHPGGHEQRHQTQPDATATSDLFTGVAVGTGIGRGIARILRHPSEGVRLNRGDILVAASTDPGWTPLFLKAGGLVVETGGTLSHAAIVARELGVPAVVNLPGILQQIEEGELLEVDGRLGVVRRLKSGEES
ncbi:MAG: PEP/pyruvate-binding domain-containing protein [Pseudomonadota bacterium]